MSKNEACRRNQRIAEYAIRKGFISRLPFVCECGDGDCYEFVLLHSRDYKQLRDADQFVTLCGHDPPDVASGEAA